MMRLTVEHEGAALTFQEGEIVIGSRGERMSDIVAHPSHYTHGGIECIDAIEAWKLGFHLGNVVKYIVRADHKGTPLEDLQKARWYLDREIKRRGGQ